MKKKALYRALFQWRLPIAEPAKKFYNRFMIWYAVGWAVVMALFVSYTVQGLPFKADTMGHKIEGKVLIAAVLVVGFSVWVFRYLAEVKHFKYLASQSVEQVTQQ